MTKRAENELEELSYIRDVSHINILSSCKAEERIYFNEDAVLTDAPHS
jgi:hypothetical protein